MEKPRAGRLRRLLRWAAGGFAALALFVLGCNLYVVLETRSLAHDDVADVPVSAVGLVLGTLPGNDFFEHRLDSAAVLWKAGKVKTLVLSGDGGPEGQNQLGRMSEGLVRRGVPATALVRDPAGYRTLDSLARVSSYGGAGGVVIVSQRFHNYRALLLAEHYGVPVSAYCAAHSESAREVMRSEWREILARVKVLLDLHMLGTVPREPPPK